MSQARRTLAWLASTPDYGPTYGKSSVLSGWCDADFCGDLDTRRSCSGRVFFLNGGPITRRAVKVAARFLSDTQSGKCRSNRCRHAYGHSTLWACPSSTPGSRTPPQLFTSCPFDPSPPCSALFMSYYAVHFRRPRIFRHTLPCLQSPCRNPLLYAQARFTILARDAH